MLKFNDQSKRGGCWLYKLLSRDMKTKKTKTNQQIIIKNNRKIKAMGNITRIPERGLLRDTDPLSNMSY